MRVSAHECCFIFVEFHIDHRLLSFGAIEQKKIKRNGHKIKWDCCLLFAAYISGDGVGEPIHKNVCWEQFQFDIIIPLRVYIVT